MRPSKHDYYLDIAEKVAMRSTCLRRMYGAVIVKDDEIISTGYNGAPRGWVNCLDIGCKRIELNIPSGERYELCRAVHAEANAIISAKRSDMIKSKLYLSCLISTNKERRQEAPKPCAMCKRLILNAGIDEIISRDSEGKITRIKTMHWEDDGFVKTNMCS